MASIHYARQGINIAGTDAPGEAQTIYIRWTGAGIVALGLLPVGFGAGLSLGVVIGELFFDHTAVTNFAFALGCFTSIVLTYVVGKAMNRYGNTHTLCGLAVQHWIWLPLMFLATALAIIVFA